MNLKILIIIAAILVIIGLALSGTIMSRVPKPVYQVVQSDGNIEIRQYAPMLVAQVEVKGKRSEAIKAGFRKLAEYIFGENIAAAGTAQVTQAGSKKIAMTAPVMQQAQQGSNNWQVQFVMPAEYTVETLPKPKKTDIRIISIPAEKYVVIRFSGMSSAANLNRHLKVLRAYIEKHKLNVTGEPIYAFYNPPWTLPFLRRNELLLQLKND